MIKNKNLWIVLLITLLSISLFLLSMSFYGKNEIYWFKAFHSQDHLSKNFVSITTFSLISVGIGLSISGAAMQGVTRNVLASSYSLGTIAISTLGIIIVNRFIKINNIYLNIILVLLFSLFFSTITLLITFSKNIDKTKIIIIGMIISTFVFAITYILEKNLAQQNHYQIF